ncbi:beta-galactosidase [Pararobbsia silviterrae]|uniref:Capsular biosynthesis protein n=1 Tax=Pararobbsia silviterrae TaxID=1792498 RepID=A0A494XSJ5_9BURK|nr:beta-galactosidase [Pararobbsia silviterrae]RKP53599.1 capsular biosynthesis protein [Pararobbsia silviterrae]
MKRPLAVACRHATRWLLPLVLLVPLVLPASSQVPSPSWSELALAQFFAFGIDEDALEGAPDQSALNRPLDDGSRVIARDGHFYRVGADGRATERVRLFGANLTFGANFPDAAQAKALARRLSKLGVNAVRLHHLDSLPSDDTDAPLSVLTTGPYPSFNPVAVARLRTLIAALSDAGIYVDLNLHVGYRFRPAVDHLPALDDGSPAPPIDAPIHVYDERLIARQIDYARGLIDRLGLRHNPALAIVEIDNESSLLNAWHDGKWNEAIPSAYEPELRQRWRTWLINRYTTLAAACDAWGGCDDGDEGALYLPKPGAAFGSGETRHKRDFVQFLAATDKAYFDRLRTVVREAVDEPVPVSGTQMTFGGVLNFDSQSAMDYVDDHIYVAHPTYPGGQGDDGHWRIPLLSASGDEMNRLLALGLRRDRRRPFIVSEFGEPFPNPRGSEMIPIMSILGAQQDWDGLFFFEYSDRAQAPIAPTEFDLAGDWGRYVTTGSSARLFRTFGIAPLQRRIDVPLPAAERLDIGMSDRDDALEHDLDAHVGAKPEWAWSGQVAEDLTAASATSASPSPSPETAPYRTPDGVVQYDPVAGRLILDGPRAWGVFGAAGAERIDLHHMSIQFGGPGRHSASVWLDALDGAELSRSRHMLLSIGSLTLGAAPGERADRPARIVPYEDDPRWMTLASGDGDAPSNQRATVPPTWMMRVPFTLMLSARSGAAHVYPLDGAGHRRAELPSTDVRSGTQGLTIAVQQRAETASPWYEIVFDAPSPNVGSPHAAN